jgi:nitrogen fixation NifU-like protein
MKTLVDDGKGELRGKGLKEEEDFFSPKAYQRWMNPLYRGSIDNPDGHARLTGKCGETIEIGLKFEKEHVSQAAFMTDGCAAITVCGSFAAEMAIGKNPKRSWKLLPKASWTPQGVSRKKKPTAPFLQRRPFRKRFTITWSNKPGRESEKRRNLSRSSTQSERNFNGGERTYEMRCHHCGWRTGRSYNCPNRKERES